MLAILAWLVLAAFAGIRVVRAAQQYADLYRARSDERWRMPHERGDEFLRDPPRWYAESFRESVRGSRFWRVVSERQADSELEQARQRVWTRIFVAAIAVALPGPIVLLSTLIRF